MAEVRQISGLWKFKGLAVEVPGDLFVNEDTHTITLRFTINMGMSEAERIFPRNTRVDYIYGTSVDGRPYVICGGVVNVNRFTFDGRGCLGYGEVVVWYVFDGLRFSEEAQLSIRRLTVDFGEIVGWARICNFMVRKDESSRSSYSWNRISQAELQLSANDFIYFNSGVNLPGELGWERKLTLWQNVDVNFCYPPLMEWRHAIVDVRRIREIISFATGRRIGVVSAKASILTDGDKEQNVKVFFGDQLVSDAKQPQILEYIFTLPELARVAKKTKNFGDLFDTIQPALELYLSPLVTDEKTIRVQFLSMMQGIELLHAIWRGNNAVTIIDGLKARYGQKLDRFDADKRFFFGLGGFTEKTYVGLRMRLWDLFFRKDEWPCKYPFGMSFGDFVNKLKVSRDYYTHYNPEEKEKAFTEEELCDLNRFLKAIFTYHMLRYFGFDEDFALARMWFDAPGLCKLFKTPANTEEWDA